MPTDPRIDEYILKSPDYAKPILRHLRKIIHAACPEVEETIKWSFPNFDYNRNILCSMAAFKQHCSFGFWLAGVMEDPDKIFADEDQKTAMGHLGQIKSLKDLPPDKILIKYTRQAMMLADKGIKLPKKVSAKSAELIIPSYFTQALKQNKKAQTTFENFSNSNKKEYVEWIMEAKSEETRNKRMEQSLEWLEEGKIRNWKYVKKT